MSPTKGDDPFASVKTFPWSKAQPSDDFDSFLNKKPAQDEYLFGVKHVRQTLQRTNNENRTARVLKVKQGQIFTIKTIL